MIHYLRAAAIALVTTLSVGISLQAQTVKDVMLDKTGAYIFAQSRDSDIAVAYDMASAELMQKIREYCKAHAITTPTGKIPETSGFIQRINGESHGQHRVFLYVTTESLSNIPTIAEGDEAQAPSAEPTENQVVKQTSASKESLTVKAPIEPEEQKTEQAKSTEPAEPQPQTPEVNSEIAVNSEHAADSESTVDSSTVSEEVSALESPEPANQIQLPEGRIGELISSILEKNSPTDVLALLEKGKSSMIISRYGQEPNKFMKHCYIVALDSGRHIHVLSPAIFEQNGARMDYATGKTIATEIKIKPLFWFMKK